MYEAGFWGGVVFDALCDSSAAYDLEGRLPQVYAEPEYLARQLRLTNVELCICHEASRNVTTAKNDSVTHENHVVTVLSEALKRLFSAGLVVKEGDLIVIDGWERKQRKVPKSQAERARNYREKKKTQKLIEDENQTNTSVTKRHIQESDANVRVTHREEESREEKKRKETKENLTSPQTSATQEPSSKAESTKDSSEGEKQKSLKTAINDLQAIYNAKLGDTHSRWIRTPKKRSQACLKWFKTRTVDDWSKLLDLVLESPFLMGQNDKGWKPSSDWLLEESRYTKVEEGQYRGSTVQPKALLSEPKAERPRGLTPAETAEMRKDQAPRPIEFLVTQAEPEYVPDYDIDGGIE